jgi:GNAT superfamily N-acetyltransferase
MVEHLSQHAAAGAPPPRSWARDLTTRSGLVFQVRPASPGDEPALDAFFGHVDVEDLRFRFLSAIRKVGQDQLKAMVTIDHDRTEHFLAFDPATGQIIATAMLAADQSFRRAEVAIAVHRDFKRMGISWTLLDHVVDFARWKGILTLESIESRDNHDAIDLERERGWIASACPGDPTSTILRMTL